jgi:cell division protein FtsB
MANKQLEKMSTLELMATIEAKNHKFKIAGFVFAGCLMAGLIILFILGVNTLQGVDTQLTQQKKLLNSQQQILASIKAGSDQNATHVKDLQDHIDCIVELFRQPNRQNLTIRDLNSCQFDSNGNIITPSGGSNVPQKSTNATPINNNGGGTSSPQSTSQPTATTTPQTPAQTGIVPKPISNLFCPINLANLTCGN